MLVYSGLRKSIRLIIYMCGLLYLTLGLGVVVYASVSNLSRYLILGEPCLLQTFVSICSMLIIGTAHFIWSISLSVFPTRVFLKDGVMSLSYAIREQDTPVSRIMWARKVLPPGGFMTTGDYSRLLVILKFSCGRFPRNWCVFPMRSKKLGLTADECPTVLDDLFEKFAR